MAASRQVPIEPGYNLAARLDTSGGLVECWNALLEIKSCSNEIITFFLNGKTDLGSECCNAISIITHHCWPAMLSSLGFTAEEGNILRGGDTGLVGKFSGGKLSGDIDCGNSASGELADGIELR
ncbi:Prolamin-like domain [Dillenia turbinata]|uniref:Prolamin-like domain n=1 Tax=Dillenia turbinata TaxID=194707 RepID=A0AAN8UW60_9MAGN